MIKQRKWYNRGVALAGLAALQLLYFPLNQHLSGGANTAFPVDAAIPLHPAWVFPYLAALPLWLVSLVAAAAWMDDRNFRSTVIALGLAILVGDIVYFTFPTFVIRPAIQSSGMAVDWLRWLYAHDQPYNALPSSHVYLTLIIALSFLRWKPQLWWIWLPVAVVVCLSTLFTKQHTLLDVLCGVVLAVLAVAVGEWAAKRLWNYFSPNK